MNEKKIARAVYSDTGQATSDIAEERSPHRNAGPKTRFPLLKS